MVLGEKEPPLTWLMMCNLDIWICRSLLSCTNGIQSLPNHWKPVFHELVDGLNLSMKRNPLFVFGCPIWNVFYFNVVDMKFPQHLSGWVPGRFGSNQLGTSNGSDVTTSSWVLWLCRKIASFCMRHAGKRINTIVLYIYIYTYCKNRGGASDSYVLYLFVIFWKFLSCFLDDLNKPVIRLWAEVVSDFGGPISRVVFPAGSAGDQNN